MKWFRRRRRPTEGADRQHLPDEVRRAKEHRYAKTARQRDLVEEVSKILFRADPVGINFGTNTDEYDAEAEMIVIALPSAGGPQDVKALTHETFVQWFDAQTAGPIERYTCVAADIWNHWQRQEGQLGQEHE